MRSGLRRIAEEMFPRWQEAGPWDCLAKLTTDEARAKINARYRKWSEDSEGARHAE